MANLTEYNNIKAAIWEAALTAVPNGIDCVECVTEMHDICNGVITKLNPPRTPVRCPECGFHGHRIDLISTRIGSN